MGKAENGEERTRGSDDKLAWESDKPRKSLQLLKSAGSHGLFLSWSLEAF